MKLFLAILLLLAHCANGGEIVDAFFKIQKERLNAQQKLREEDLKAINKEPDPQKRIELLSQAGKRLGASLPNGKGFQFFTNNGLTEVGNGNIVTNHKISEIGIERTGCFGTCPSYVFIVTSDGKCRYEGGEHAKIEGKKNGRTSSIDFHRLAEFLLQIQYFDLKDQYTASITDSPSTYTTAVVNGKRKIIENYAGLGPAQLWAVEQILDGFLARARWDE